MDVADESLVVTMRAWLAQDPWFYKDVQTAVRTWLTAKGYA